MVYTQGSLDFFQTEATYHDRSCDALTNLHIDHFAQQFEIRQPLKSSDKPNSIQSSDRNSDIPSIICSACGYKNYSGEMFCQKCGVQLVPVISIPPIPQHLDIDVQTVPSQRTLSIGRLVLQDNQSVLELRSQDGICVIGRSDPVLDLYPEVDLNAYDAEEKGVSRRHAKIFRTSEGLFIEDLNSTNFTFLNGVRLEPENRYPLKEGDEIRLGYLEMIFHSNL